MPGCHIALFAGVGMTDIAAEQAGFKTIATAEVDEFCRSVLERRYPDAMHYGDVRDVTANSALKDAVEQERPLMVSGGFPCQDVSSAGTGQGLDGERSGLWTEFARVIREFRPEVALIENSPMLRSRGLDRVLTDLWRLGYAAKWDCIPAAAVGAPHMRDRIFIVAVPHPTPDYQGGTCRFINVNPDKLPRAGTMTFGVVSECEPQATIRDAKQAILAHAVPCPATPAASNPQDGESAESWLARRELLKAKGINGNGAGMPLSIAVRLFPTPTKADGSGGPGTTPKRTGGPNLRTVVAAEDGNGRLNPLWVEWMMGLPLGWTDPTVANKDLIPHPGWAAEPCPRTVGHNEPNRSKRIRALGNGLVPQAAAVALDMTSKLEGAI